MNENTVTAAVYSPEGIVVFKANGEVWLLLTYSDSASGSELPGTRFRVPWQLPSNANRKWIQLPKVPGTPQPPEPEKT